MVVKHWTLTDSLKIKHKETPRTGFNLDKADKGWEREKPHVKNTLLSGMQNNSVIVWSCMLSWLHPQYHYALSRNI